MNLKTNWSSASKTQRQTSIRDLVNAPDPDFLQEHNYIRLVAAGKRGVYASLGENFTYAIFGRDSIEVAEDLLEAQEDLARNIILTMASLQGLKTDNITEEETGRIHHEYRARVFEGEAIPEVSLAILSGLQRDWGGKGTDHMIYYGAVDSTPLYIRLISRYVSHYGDSILSQVYTDREGQEQTIAHSMRIAVDWLVAKLEKSSWKLLEYERRNPNGLANQVWKDSDTAYLHLDGSLANTSAGIASIEVQGYAYDALLAASELVAKNTQQRNKWQKLATSVQTSTLERFWMPEEKFFAEALDRGPKGQTRQVKTLTSNAAVLLETKLLYDLPQEQALPYVEAVIRTICGPEFITPAGIRSRALRHQNLPGFIDYHGSYTVWPKETYDIAKGFRQFGFDHLAEQLENRILRTAEIAGEFYEFYYVEGDGKIWHFGKEALEHFKEKARGANLPIPEPAQAWVISAVMAIINRRLNHPKTQPMNSFEESIFNHMFKSTLILAEAGFHPVYAA